MEINIGNHKFTELWNQVFYKKLSQYPILSDWEMRTIIEFVEYEKTHGRKATIYSENKELLTEINEKLNDKEYYLQVQRPAKITECTACPKRKGCMTKYLCHTASLENALSILQSGKLLSAVNARHLSDEQLMKEERNAAHDPEDFFHYIMFSWGNCQAGDRLVMERALKRFPTEAELSDELIPGVRFYFLYDQLEQHPGATHDGVIPLKVKDEVIVKDWVTAIIVPKEYQSIVEPLVPEELKKCMYYLDRNNLGLWEWVDMVYSFVEML